MPDLTHTTTSRRGFLAAALTIGSGALLGLRPHTAVDAAPPAPPVTPDVSRVRISDLTPEELEAYVNYLDAAVDEVARVFPGELYRGVWTSWDCLLGVCARRTPPAKLRPAKVWRTRGTYRELHRLMRERPDGWPEVAARFWHVVHESGRLARATT